MAKGPVKPIEPPAPLDARRPPEVEPWHNVPLDIPETPRSKPDVSRWVEVVNERLSGTWAQNELRCGRYVRLPGITEDELAQLMDVFKAFELVPSREQGDVCLTFRVRRSMSTSVLRGSGPW